MPPELIEFWDNPQTGGYPDYIGESTYNNLY